jgi:hypothetical protein
VLLKILSDKRIIGSTGKGYICGGHTAVCFQDAPLYGIAQNILHEQTYRDDLGGKVRYSSNGLVFLKKTVYKKGGRPVIYDKLDDAKKYLDQSEWWRIVSFDLDDKDNILDWTHEREWRVKGDFKFTLGQVYVLIGNAKSYKEFIKKADPSILSSIAGITAIVPILK